MRIAWTLAVTSCLLLLSPSRSAAAIAFAESTEWVLASSDRVMIGKVVDVAFIADAEMRECQSITIAVSKTLKGTHAERVTFVMPAYIYREYGKQWKDEGIPLVVCLKKNDGKRVAVSVEKHPWVVRDDGNGPNVILLGKSKNQFTGGKKVFTRNLEILTDPQAIADFVVQTVAELEKDPPRTFYSMRVPGKTAVSEELYSGSAVFLAVPVDGKCEAIGREWCKSDVPRNRIEGATMLSRFKNDKNIEILKSLLADPHTVEMSGNWSVAGESGTYLKTVYDVRKTAYEALRIHGVDVERPLLQILREGKEPSDASETNKKGAP